MKEINIAELVQTLLKTLLEYTPKVIAAIVILLFGLWFISVVTKTAKKIMIKRNIELTLANFLGNIIFWGLRVLLFVIVISKLGIETSSFVAVLGAAGLAIGLSLQGSLSNFAGGILIILFKPFKLGDVIEAQGVLGTVKEIKIFSTIVDTFQNRRAIIPNAALSNGNIINYTVNGTARIDIIISVAYESDLQKVKEILQKIVNHHPKILKSPEPAIFVHELASSSINFAVRPWVNVSDFIEVQSDVLLETKLAFDKASIEIPYPHQVEISKNG